MVFILFYANTFVPFSDRRSGIATAQGNALGIFKINIAACKAAIN
jgi:hypothetical protein